MGKNIIIGDNTDLYSQAYASYDSKKAGGVTRMHLRFSKKPIRSTYLVIIHTLFLHLNKDDMLKGLREGGTFLLNTTTPKEEIEALLPNRERQESEVHIINLVMKLGCRINTIMQSAFFKLNEHLMSADDANKYMKKYAEKTYGRKGEAVVELNNAAIDAGYQHLIEVKAQIGQS